MGDHDLELIEFEGSAEALGHAPVSLTLSGRRTVLFGRNGAGKSVLLELMERAAETALGSRMPMHLRSDLQASFTFRDGDSDSAGPLRYGVRFYPHRVADEDGALQMEYVLSEDCARLAPTNLKLWSVADEVASGPTLSQNTGLPQLMGLLTLKYQEEWQLPEHAALRWFLRRLHRVPAGVPRARDRQFVWLERREGQPMRQQRSMSPRLNRILRRIVSWHEREDGPAPEYQEFCDVCERLGVLRTVKIEVLRFNREEDTELIWVQIDGVDLGLASDGTLRTVELVIALIDSSPGSLLLIEEPETGIHPELLEGILAEINAYTASKQVVISTHSPQVVAWAAPEDLRLVERVTADSPEREQTTVRPLTEEEVTFAERYLCETGTLGEFVYGGGLDD